MTWQKWLLFRKCRVAWSKNFKSCPIIFLLKWDFFSVQCKRIFHNLFFKEFQNGDFEVMCKFYSFWLCASPVSKNICIFRSKNFLNIITNLNSRLELCPNSHIYFMLKSLQKSPKLSKFPSACAFCKVSKKLFYKKIIFLPIFWHIKTRT